jgi:heptosyltransferase-3
MQSSILGGPEKNKLQPEQSVRRILIYRLGSLGDTVVALPCFHLIARTFPQTERVLLTNFPIHAKAPASAAVLGDSGLVHGYMRYTVGTRNMGELLRLAWRIRRFRPDVLIYLMPVRPLNNVRRDRLFFRAAGVPRIIGLPSEEELNHRFDAATGLYESEASRLGRALAELGDAGSGESANWNLDLTNGERQTAVAALGTLAQSPLIVCGPGTKMQAKDWGQDNWRALLTRVHAEYPRHGLALIGAKEDARVSDYAAQEWTGPKVNLCGQLTPRETAAVLEHADVFLGPDSGPMHLAASVGVPCAIAFSAAGLPGVWFPAGEQHQIVYHQTSCHGCKLETCFVEARRCLTSITVAEMAEAVAKAMRRQTGGKSTLAVL